MTCEEAFKRLYDVLNSESENLTAEQMEQHFKLCRLTCDTCKFNEEVLKLMQDGPAMKKASPELRNRIMCGLKLTN